MNLIDKLIEIGKEVHSRNWVPATGGNLSAKINEERIIITRSGSHKGYLTVKDFVVVDMNGNLVEGDGKPSAETLLHATVYKLFPWVGSVLHVHSLNSTLISRLTDGQIVLEDYELIKAFGYKTHRERIHVPVLENSQDMEELSRLVRDVLTGTDKVVGFILRSHGVYVWGKDPWDAFVRLEALDFLLECELKLMGVRS